MGVALIAVRLEAVLPEFVALYLDARLGLPGETLRLLKASLTSDK